jgi:hypothetical protein
MWYVEVAQVLMGVTLGIALPIQHVAQRRAWARRTRRVVGVVVGSRLRGGGWSTEHHGIPTARALVEFEVGGRTYTAESRYGASWIEPKPGEKQPVVYAPSDPTDCEVYSETWRSIETWFVLTLSLIGAGALVAVALRHLA